jgi:hypothetical protein
MVVLTYSLITKAVFSDYANILFKNIFIYYHQLLEYWRFGKKYKYYFVVYEVLIG